MGERTITAPMTRFRPLHDGLILLCALCALGSGVLEARAQSGVSITATVTPQTVELNEELVYKLAISGRANGLELTKPRFDGFDAGHESVSQVIRPGVNRLDYSWTLRPKRAGQLTIPSAELRQAGRVVARSQPLQIHVQKPAPLVPISAAKNRDLKRYRDKTIFAHYTTPRGTYYVGEPFPLNLYVYYRADLQLSSIDVTTTPKLNGLLVEELQTDTQRRASQVRVAGRAMNRYPLAIQLATPLKPGRILVDSAGLTVGISRGLMRGSQRKARATQPFWIDIQPVPTEGRPEGYRQGNIGRFKLSSRVANQAGNVPNRVKTGERLVMTVEVAGQGNLISVKAPALDASDTWQVQELPGAGTEDVIAKDQHGMHGTRTFQYLLTALKPGDHPLPKVNLVTFDPRRGRFINQSAGGGTITVTGQAVTGEVGAAELIGEDIRPIIEDATIRQHADTDLTGSLLFWALLALPLLGWVAAEVVFRRRQRDAADPDAKRARGAYALAKRRLKAAESAQAEGKVKDFYGQISRTLLMFLEDKTGIPATGMTHDELRRAGQSVGYAGAQMDAVIVELENCDFARFAPTPAASTRMREVSERVATLLKGLEDVSPRRRS